MAGAPGDRTAGVLWRAGHLAGEYTVLPDGCMDIIWTGEHLLIVGADTAPFVGYGAHSSSPIGFRFHPGIAPSVIGHDAHALTDSRIPAGDLWPSARVAEWTEQLCASVNPAATLVALCTESAGRPPRVAEAATMLGSGHPVTDVADRLGVTTRTLHRLSLRHFGYGPKTLARILRMRRALDLLPGADPSTVAYSAGYADYAHMFRDLTELTGRSPVAFTSKQAGPNQSSSNQSSAQ